MEPTKVIDELEPEKIKDEVKETERPTVLDDKAGDKLSQNKPEETSVAIVNEDEGIVDEIEMTDEEIKELERLAAEGDAGEQDNTNGSKADEEALVEDEKEEEVLDELEMTEDEIRELERMVAEANEEKGDDASKAKELDELERTKAELEELEHLAAEEEAAVAAAEAELLRLEEEARKVEKASAQSEIKEGEDEVVVEKSGVVGDVAADRAAFFAKLQGALEGGPKTPPGASPCLLAVLTC